MFLASAIMYCGCHSSVSIISALLDIAFDRFQAS